MALMTLAVSRSTAARIASCSQRGGTGTLMDFIAPCGRVDIVTVFAWATRELRADGELRNSVRNRDETLNWFGRALTRWHSNTVDSSHLLTNADWPVPSSFSEERTNRISPG